jgi:hypothetical protein
LPISRSVTSSRVPEGSFRFIMNCPGSVRGKKAKSSSGRDSICSIPAPSVKNRSKRLVISVSICSGGIPE